MHLGRRRLFCSSRGEHLEECFKALSVAAGLEHAAEQVESYNLQMTARWMLLVPRSASDFRGVGANGVSYAGTFFLRSQEEIDTVREYGPLRVLAEMGVPW
jgi:sulfate adenylyltransferase (ADP) / ATP adenylyltransferase